MAEYALYSYPATPLADLKVADHLDRCPPVHAFLHLHHFLRSDSQDLRS